MKLQRIKAPWPTKDAMHQIYKMNLWGGSKGEFYSGEGSHFSNIVNPYLKIVKSFLASFQKPLIVYDLGCGDFNVGKELVHYSKKYIAIDIVNDLIEFNREKFKAKNLEFDCLDIAIDKFPIEECVILRQVLQHLSNSEIHLLVEKLEKCKYLILTEHLPIGKFIPNIDIISGQGIRLKKHSGIVLSQKPFNYKFKNEIELLTFNLKDGKSKIVTTLYEI
jgi:SAM-dependent methyltransferase